jgi:hypothetical protein
MRAPKRPAVLLPCAAAALWIAVSPILAVQRQLVRQIRERYEGRIVRLRVDLKPATYAHDPNVISSEGIGHARESATFLFGRLETVYLDRIAREGRSRLSLTVYRSREEADRLRASATPPSIDVNPNYGRTLATFAQRGSTSVVLELQAGKRDPERQLEEIESLLDRVFFLTAEPTHAELEEFVRRHPGMSVTRLRALTGLEPDHIKEILSEVRRAPAPPG